MYLDMAVTSRNVKVAIKRHSREVAHVLDVHIVFDITFELPEGLHLRSLFHALCAVVPLENIEGLTVDISSDAGFEPSHWLNFLRNAERVQTMDVSDQAAMQFIPALKQELSLSQTSSAARVLLFPVLKGLTIREVDHDKALGPSSFDEKIVKVFTHRAEINNPLEELEIICCDISEECVQALRNIIPTVQNDGQRSAASHRRYMIPILFPRQ